MIVFVRDIRKMNGRPLKFVNLQSLCLPPVRLDSLWPSQVIFNYCSQKQKSRHSLVLDSVSTVYMYFKIWHFLQLFGFLYLPHFFDNISKPKDGPLTFVYAKQPHKQQAVC